MLSVRLLVACAATAAALPAHAVEFTLISPDTPARDWSIDSTQLNMRDGPPFKVRMHRLSGGRQEGSVLVEIDTGAMQLTVVPTRGMNVLRAQAGSVRLGWDSPVSEVVNPAFVNLESRSGLGWLEGFNEFVARCGFAWVGHPGKDRGELLTLHGRASYLPARTVVLSIDDRSPHRITLTGMLSEAAFKKVDFRIDTALTTEPGATAIHPARSPDQSGGPTHGIPGALPQQRRFNAARTRCTRDATGTRGLAIQCASAAGIAGLADLSWPDFRIWRDGLQHLPHRRWQGAEPRSAA